MPISFKPQRLINIVIKTPAEDLEFCSTCGGLNAKASTAVKIDCTECGTTGYSNYYTRVSVMASYRPGGEKRWNPQTGGTEYYGECSIKLNARYESMIADASFIEMDDAAWKFNVLRTPGEAFGQKRLVLALTRK